MHVLKMEGDAKGPALGPAVMVDILLERHPVKALVETGPPITIVSIDCLLEVLERKWVTGQTVQNWKRQVEE